MSKPKRFANEDVMETYLGSLLDGHDNIDEQKEQAAKLLSNVELIELPVSERADDPVVKEPVVKDPIVNDIVIKAADERKADSDLPTNSQALQASLESTFQALFFDVAGLTLAVPLVTLGGIHQLDKVGPLFGKPDWFMGVMLHRDEKLNVVNTAKWVMPEKTTQTLEDGLNYKYLIMLAESQWGLASENLVNTVTLNKSDVKWRDNDSKRPWLAGMVKERMCALIDVYQLVSLLNKGLSSDSQD
jgi:purine-binding chemotaxis protein CheW